MHIQAVPNIDLDDVVRRGNQRMTRDDLTLLARHAAAAADGHAIVEIGAMDGCSTMVLGTVAKAAGVPLYTVEPRVRPRWSDNVADYGLSQTVRVLQYYSPWVPLAKVPSPIDFLLIDGDHRCSRAIADYVWWGRFVRAGGRIAFHDIDGGRGVADWIREAVKICQRDDNLGSEQGPDYKIRQIERTPPANNRGTVCFEKQAAPLTEDLGHAR